MKSFSSILKHAKKMHETKEGGGVWRRCEECDAYKLCYPFKDSKNEVWQLCELCASQFIKD